jgi:putative transposase
LTDPERSTLAVIGKRLGPRGLELVAAAAKPDTILSWFRKLGAQKFDGSRHRLYPGRPPIPRKLVELIVRLARENSGWGYDRIAGALAILGHRVSDQTVGNVLRRYGIPPAPKRRQHVSLAYFIRSHMGRTGRHRFLYRGRAHFGAVWQPIMYCSSCTWEHAALLWQESPNIPTQE